MIREDLGAASKHATVVVTPESRVCLQYRAVPGNTMGTTNSDVNDARLPHWIQLTRVGDTFIAQHSDDGNTWQDVRGEDSTQATSAVVKMSPTTCIGLLATSHRGRWRTVAAKVSNVTVTGNVSPVGEFVASEDIGFTMVAIPTK